MKSIICFLGGIFIFWLAFWEIAPYITSLIPAGEWHSLLSLIVYILVGYLGGVAIPILLIIFGLVFLFK